MRQFNPQLRYLAGVTANEAAYIVCKLANIILYTRRLNEFLLSNLQITTKVCCPTLKSLNSFST